MIEKIVFNTIPKKIATITRETAPEMPSEIPAVPPLAVDEIIKTIIIPTIKTILKMLLSL